MLPKTLLVPTAATIHTLLRKSPSPYITFNLSGSPGSLLTPQFLNTPGISKVLNAVHVLYGEDGIYKCLGDRRMEGEKFVSQVMSESLSRRAFEESCLFVDKDKSKSKDKDKHQHQHHFALGVGCTGSVVTWPPARDGRRRETKAFLSFTNEKETFSYKIDFNVDTFHVSRSSEGEDEDEDDEGYEKTEEYIKTVELRAIQNDAIDRVILDKLLLHTLLTGSQVMIDIDNDDFEVITLSPLPVVDQVGGDSMLEQFMNEPKDDKILFISPSTLSTSSTSPTTKPNIKTTLTLPTTTSSSSNNDKQQVIVFPGSFNPLHEGHVKLANLAYLDELWGYSNENDRNLIYFEIACHNVDKPSLSIDVVKSRLGQFFNDDNNLVFSTSTSTSGESKGDVNGDFPYGVILTSLSPMFYQKAILIHSAYSTGQTTATATATSASSSLSQPKLEHITFVIGYDTLIRLINPKYYNSSQIELTAKLLEMKDLGCRFLIAGRVGGDGVFESGEKELEGLEDDGVRGMFRVVGGERFRVDLSSSQLRK